MKNFNSQFIWVVCLGLMLTSGCVRRSLTIKTDPPGAMVYINDQLKGTSPLTYDFVWYGWHRVMLRKEGFERLDDRKLLRAPVCLWIPLDVVMELLPFSIRDTREWSYALTPTPPAPAPVPPGGPEEPPVSKPPTAAPATTEPSHDAASTR